MIAEYWPPSAAAAVDSAAVLGRIDAVVVRSMLLLLRLKCLLAVDFLTFTTAAFCTLAVVAFLAFGLAFVLAVLAEVAMKPSFAFQLSGAASAALKAKVITPAAIAAVTTVNFCMWSCSVWA